MKPEINNNIIAKDKLKDVLVTKTAIKTLKSVAIVDKVISHSFKAASIALKTHREVEITGFGIFKTNDYRAKQLIEKKEKLLAKIERRLKEGDDLKDSSRLTYEKEKDKLILDIRNLKLKLNKPNED